MTATPSIRDAVEPPPAQEPGRGAARVRRWASWVVDAVGVLALAALLWYLAGRDGGTGMSTWHLGGVAALGIIPAVCELRRSPATVKAVVAAWTLAALASLVFAVDRSGFVAVTLVYAFMPIVGLTTMRLLRRPWGRLLVIGLVVGALALYWHRSFLQWWGYTLSDLDARWLSLSWHNQSATLMGALGVFFFAVAATTKRVLSAAAGVLAALGLAGAWLAGSRGAVVAVVLGLAVAVWLGGRWQGWRRTLVVAPALLLAAVAVAGGLLAMDEQAERITSDAPATGNLFARLHHMEAAGGMFLSRPATGYGLGSYGTSARPHTSPEANLTGSPHNELLEPFAEGGLLFGLAVLAGAALVAYGSWRVLIRPAPAVAKGDVRGQLEAASMAAGAATVVVLLSHALVDFDWRYPVLAGLLALAGALAWQPPEPSSTSRPRRSSVLGAAAGVGLVALLAAGLAGAWTERPTQEGPVEVTAEQLAHRSPAWDATGNAQAAARLLRGGNPDEAAQAVARTRPWNPGRSALRGLALIAEVERGRLAPEALVGAFGPHPTRFTLHNLAAELLIERGELDVASELLDESLRVHAAHAGWGVDRPVVRSWELLIELRLRRAGCDGVAGLLAQIERDPVVGDVDAAIRHLHDVVPERCGEGAE